MKKQVITLFLLSAALLLRADDITLSDGTVLKNAKVVSHSLTSATIETDNGGSIVPLERLPKDLQQKLGYDPQAAKEAVAQREKDSNEATATMDEDGQFKAAAKKYVAVGDKLYARVDDNTYKLTVKLIQTGQVEFSDGRVLGRGSSVSLFRPKSVIQQTGGGAAPIAVDAGLSDTGETVILAWPLDTDQIQTVDLVKIGVSSTGSPIFAKPAPPSLDQWRKAGKPQ